MLKRILENLEGLEENLKPLYKKGADNKFHLDVEDDNRQELLDAKEHEKGLRKIAEQERDTARTELTAAQEKVRELTASQSTGVAQLRQELEASYGTQITKLKADHAKEKEKLESAIKKVFVDEVADKIANKISTVPDILSEVLKKRLSVEIVDGEPITRVLTVDGKASAMTPDDLGKEYFTNEKYAGIMRANDASGGGASGGNKGGGASSKKLADMNDSERKEWNDRDPAGFAAAVEADKSKTTTV